METPDTSIKRAPRTYGRRRVLDASDADAILTAESSASSNQNSPALSDSVRDVPPSSDFETSFTHGDDEDGNDAPDDSRHMLGHNLSFDWKRKMKKISSNCDDDMEDAPPPRGLVSDSEEEPAERGSRPTHDIGADVGDAAGGEDVPLPKTLFRRSVKDDLAQIDMEFDKAAEEWSHKGEAPPLFTDTPDDPFGAPLPILREDTQPTDVHTTPSASSSAPHHRRVAKRRVAVHASDSEGEDLPRSSPLTSPGALHSISTPKTASSPTPPTTEEMAKAKSKGKQKSVSSANLDDDELPNDSSSKTQGRTRGKHMEKQKRVKAPTQKERLEAQKTTARIKAEQTIALTRENKPLPTASLFMKYSAKVDEELHLSGVKQNPSEGSLSDHIEQFSSPAHVERPSFTSRPSGLRGNPFRTRSATVEPKPQLQFVPTGLLGGSSSRPSVPPSRLSRASGMSEGGQEHTDFEPSSDDDTELPDVPTLLQKEKEKRIAQEQRAKFQEMKMRLVHNQKPTEVDDSSDLEIVDNDMHTVAREEDEERKAMKARRVRPSMGRTNQLTFAGRSTTALSPSKASPVRRSRHDLQVLQAAAAPIFSTATRVDFKKGKERAAPKVNRDVLNAILLKANRQQNKEAVLQKEREFYRGGTIPRDRMPTDEDVEQAKKERIRELVRRGVFVAQQRQLAEDGDDEAQADDESDGEWTPAAPHEDHAEQEGVGSEGEDENAIPMQETDPTQASDDQEEDQENIHRNRPSRKYAMVVDSDEEDGNAEPSTGRVLVANSSLTLDGSPMLSLNHRGSVSSLSDRLEEGTDKENDARLMFDRGDDKENTVIATSPLGFLRGRGSSFLQDTPGPLTATHSQERTPLQEIPAEDDDDNLLSSPSRPPRLRTTISREGTPGPLRPQGVRTQALAAFFEPSLPLGKGRTCENESEQQCSLEPAADIGGGFSQFFEPTLKNTSSHASMGQEHVPSTFTPSTHAGSHSKGNISLTLGSLAQPSLHVDKERIRKANDIFEKEQEVVAERVVAEKLEVPSGMFVNENGFLTQSTTGTALPAWALLSPTSPLFAHSSPAFQTGSSVLKSTAKQRQPLGTLALAVEQEQDSDSERPKRLHKRASTPDTTYRSSASPSPITGRSAFDVLGRNQEKIRAPKFPMKKLGKSTFVQGEAEESDEDAGFGFGITKKKDDEEELDGEDQDKILEELVDDADMDEETLNEEGVLEKVQEHRVQDDAADEKIARDAAEGKMRTKRRNRLLDFEDEDSDEEDEDARRRRQRMAKKRKIDGDTLEQLAGNPETRAFVQAYRAEIEDDNEEFAHLDQDEMSLTFIGDNDLEDQDEVDDEEEPPEVVSTVQLQEELRKVARGEKMIETIDTNNVDWVSREEDEDMADEDVRIREVATSSNRTTFGGAKSGQMDWEPIQQSHRGDSTHDLSREKSLRWARGEGGSRNAGTGRASAVTGITKSVKAGGGSLTGRRTEQRREKAPAKLDKAPSILSAVSSRRTKFASSASSAVTRHS